jgi:transcriptional regulator with XRE-family HTH domain
MALERVTRAPHARFGPLLRQHRAQLGLSQERLAERAEISTRHLSFLETGKAAPSRSMVLVLGSALDLSLREKNALLESAAFSAAFRDSPLESPEAAALLRAVEFVLERMEPHGAIAIDRGWDVLRMNRAAASMLSGFLAEALPPDAARNIVLGTLHPSGLRPYIVNFEEVACVILDRLRRELLRAPGDRSLAALAAKVRLLPDLPSSPRIAELAGHGPFVTVHLRRGDVDLRLFSTIASIGTPIDATAEELRIETYFPADDGTARWLADLQRSC